MYVYTYVIFNLQLFTGLHVFVVMEFSIHDDDEHVCVSMGSNRYCFGEKTKS